MSLLIAGIAIFLLVDAQRAASADGCAEAQPP
jgi:hypothetical protein